MYIFLKLLIFTSNTFRLSAQITFCTWNKSNTYIFYLKTLPPPLPSLYINAVHCRCTSSVSRFLALPVRRGATSYWTSVVRRISGRWRSTRILERRSAGRWRRRICTVAGSGRVAVGIRRKAAGGTGAARSSRWVRWARCIQNRGIRAEAVIANALRERRV